MQVIVQLCMKTNLGFWAKKNLSSYSLIDRLYYIVGIGKALDYTQMYTLLGKNCLINHNFWLVWPGGKHFLDDIYLST